MIQVLTLLWEEMTMNLLEKLMSIINKQKQAILFSQKDKEIIREIREYPKVCVNLQTDVR